jgi:hypothetical protein
VKAFDRINVQNNPVNWVDLRGLNPGALIGTGTSSSGMGVGSAGYAQPKSADLAWEGHH